MEFTNEIRLSTSSIYNKVSKRISELFIESLKFGFILIMLVFQL